jgi:hypothetical protein
MEAESSRSLPYHEIEHPLSRLDLELDFVAERMTAIGHLEVIAVAIDEDVEEEVVTIDAAVFELELAELILESAGGCGPFDLDNESAVTVADALPRIGAGYVRTLGEQG